MLIILHWSRYAKTILEAMTGVRSGLAGGVTGAWLVYFGIGLLVQCHPNTMPRLY